jgi:hypothetical protein
MDHGIADHHADERDDKPQSKMTRRIEPKKLLALFSGLQFTKHNY